MNIASVERRLEAGEKLKIKYKYPIEAGETVSRSQCGMRSDKLLDVSTELQRLYVNFRGMIPIWLKVDEVIEITPDDGVYEDFVG